MESFIEIGIVLGLGAATFIVLMLRSKRKNASRKAPPLPSESGKTWSNNSIRKLGKEGKGIR